MNTTDSRPVFGPWRYESDGEPHERTHYAVRDNAAEPCGEERMDFASATLARRFVIDANALIMRLMNPKESA